MHTRRDGLRAGAAALAASIAGCSSIPFVGDDPLEFLATRTTVPESVRQDTGYEEASVSELTIERTFEAGGQSQDVVVTNWLAEYDKAIDVSEIGPFDERARAAVFTMLSTPQVSVLGQEFNPIEDMSSRELVEMVQERFDNLQNIEQAGTTGALVAGEETTAGEFNADAQFTGTGAQIPVVLHVTEAVAVGGDFLITIGAYPRGGGPLERDNVFTMMEQANREA